MTGSRTRTLALIGAATLMASGCASVHRMTAGPCHDTTVSLYFETGGDVVPPIGQEIVAATAKRLRGCQVRELTLLGLADASGSSANNLELSKRRADNVLSSFVKAGLPVPKYTLVAAGDKGAVDAAGVAEPVRRRVDVTVVVGK